jgi:hypothetical protein
MITRKPARTRRSDSCAHCWPYPVLSRTTERYCVLAQCAWCVCGITSHYCLPVSGERVAVRAIIRIIAPQMSPAAGKIVLRTASAGNGARTRLRQAPQARRSSQTSTLQAERSDMAKGTCTHPDGCQEEVLARELCSRHYRQARRRGEFPPRRLTPGVHSLSNVDHDARIGDCTVCGPQVKVRVRTRTRGNGDTSVAAECGTVVKASKKRQLARTGLRRRRRQRTKERYKYSKYKMTLDDYRVMYASQQGRCAICLKECPVLFVDHDHESRAVRGLLCRECNSALGFLHDSVEAARRAADYLQASKQASKVEGFDGAAAGVSAARDLVAR